MIKALSWQMDRGYTRMYNIVKLYVNLSETKTNMKKYTIIFGKASPLLLAVRPRFL